MGFEQKETKVTKGKGRRDLLCQNRGNLGGGFWGQNPHPKFPRWVFLREPSQGFLPLLPSRQTLSGFPICSNLPSRAFVSFFSDLSDTSCLVSKFGSRANATGRVTIVYRGIPEVKIRAALIDRLCIVLLNPFTRFGFAESSFLAEGNGKPVRGADGMLRIGKG
jgi:hypothetical protein